MKYVTLHIGGIEKYFIKLHYTKNHPSPDPDIFDLTLTPEEVTGIKNFDVVEIKKDGVTEFYGFVEEITPDLGDDGLEYVVSGRCWKVILWKKWTERYQESREVGPSDVEGNVESGFFGAVNPTELIKFIMRCPMSVHPKGKIRHKIGWGIPSDYWTYCTNETAECFYPDWVGMRTTGLSWRSKGAITNMNISTLVVDGFTGTYGTDWSTFGVSPWLNDDDRDSGNWISNYLMTFADSNWFEGDFTFADLDPTAYTVYTAELGISYRLGWADLEYIKAELYDGISWHELGVFEFTVDWITKKFNVTSILDTVQKVNAAKIRFSCILPSRRIDVSYAYLEVEWTTVSGSIYQEANDYFIINLGTSYDRVTAILLECRNNPSNYARNYEIKYAMLSNCCGLGESDWHDFDPVVDVTDNTYRDILHSWKPVDDVHCIRIKLTASASSAWEISQVYIWQGDEEMYRVMDEV